MNLIDRLQQQVSEVPKRQQVATNWSNHMSSIKTCLIGLHIMFVVGVVGACFVAVNFDICNLDLHLAL